MIVTFSEDSVFWSQDCTSDFTVSHLANITLAYKERLHLAPPKPFEIGKITECSFYLSQQQNLYDVGTVRRPTTFYTQFSDYDINL